MSPSQFKKNAIEHQDKYRDIQNCLAELELLYKREMPDPQSSLAPAAQYHFKNPGKSFRAKLALTSGSR